MEYKQIPVKEVSLSKLTKVTSTYIINNDEVEIDNQTSFFDRRFTLNKRQSNN